MSVAVRIPVNLKVPQSSTNLGNAWYTSASLTAYDSGHWEFKKDVIGKAFGQVMVPPSYASGGSLILQLASSGTSGVSTMSVATKCVADGASLNPSSLTDETDIDVTMPGTAYLRKEVVFTLTETLTASGLLLVEVHHVGTATNDTHAFNTLLYGAWLGVSVA